MKAAPPPAKVCFGILSCYFKNIHGPSVSRRRPFVKPIASNNQLPISRLPIIDHTATIATR
jgi:hypothetical protein